MRRIVINLTSTLITFTFGITAASLLNWTNYPVKNHEPLFGYSEPPAVDETNPTPATVADPTASSKSEVVFSRERLKIVTDQAQLKNERLRYDIDVRYPQIIGTDDYHIRELNQHIKTLATERYQWPLNPSKAVLRYYRENWPEVFNSVDLDYEIISANDSFLSIYFVEYSYGIGAAHSVQSSFVVNYDLTLGKELQLSAIFNRGSKYLQFISQYCGNEISKESQFIFAEALAPRSEHFESWNITRDGIRFNFDACQVLSCANGEQNVEIPFTDLKPFLNRQVQDYFTTKKKS